MNLQNNILIVLVTINLVMIGSSFKAGILPPASTGAGFLAISYIQYSKP